jgi:hypothetical protein
MQVAALAPRLQRARRLDPRGLGITAEALDARPGLRPERQAPLDRGTREPGQRQRFGRERVDGVAVHGEAASDQQPADAAGDRRHQPGDVRVGGCWQAVKPHRPVHPRREHAVEPQDMEMNVQFQPGTKPLHHGDRAAAAVGDPGTARAAAIPAEHGADEHAQDRATERVVERQPVAQSVRHGEHPLAHGRPRQDRVDEVRRLFGHASPPAAGADSAGLA